MVPGVTSNQVGLVDISTGLRLRRETYDHQLSFYNFLGFPTFLDNNESSFIIIAAQIFYFVDS